MELMKVVALSPLLVALNRSDKSEDGRRNEKTVMLYTLLITFILTSLMEVVL